MKFCEICSLENIRLGADFVEALEIGSSELHVLDVLALAALDRLGAVANSVRRRVHLGREHALHRVDVQVEHERALVAHGATGARRLARDRLDHTVERDEVAGRARVGQVLAELALDSARNAAALVVALVEYDLLQLDALPLDHFGHRVFEEGREGARPARLAHTARRVLVLALDESTLLFRVRVLLHLLI